MTIFFNVNTVIAQSSNPTAAAYPVLSNTAEIGSNLYAFYLCNGGTQLLEFEPAPKQDLDTMYYTIKTFIGSSQPITQTGIKLTSTTQTLTWQISVVPNAKIEISTTYGTAKSYPPPNSPPTTTITIISNPVRIQNKFVSVFPETPSSQSNIYTKFNTASETIIENHDPYHDRTVNLSQLFFRGASQIYDYNSLGNSLYTVNSSLPQPQQNVNLSQLTIPKATSSKSEAILTTFTCFNTPGNNYSTKFILTDQSPSAIAACQIEADTTFSVLSSIDVPGCVTRCGPGNVSLLANGPTGTNYHWFVPNIPFAVITTTAGQPYNYTLGQNSTVNFTVKPVIGGQVAECGTQVNAISDPVRITVTPSSYNVCADQNFNITVSITNLDCNASKNLNLNFNQGSFIKISGHILPASIVLAPNATQTFVIIGKYLNSGTFDYLVTASDSVCSATGKAKINVTKGEFEIETYTTGSNHDGFCAGENANFTPTPAVSFGTFKIFDELNNLVDSCTSTSNAFNTAEPCIIPAPTTPGIYTVKFEATSNGCTKQTSQKFYIFGKNRSFRFDGVDDRIIADLSLEYERNNSNGLAFTLEAWVNLSPELQDKAAIITKGDWHTVGLAFNTGSNGEYLELTIAGQTVQSKNFPSIYDESCHHIAVSRTDDGSISFYLDGEYQGSGVNDSEILSMDPLMFGNDALTEMPGLLGKLDEVRFWKIYRSMNEVDNAKNLRIPDNFDQVIGYWPLNENNNQELLDYSNIRNDAKLGISLASGNEDPESDEEVCLTYCEGNPYRVSAANRATNPKAKAWNLDVRLAPNPFTEESILIVNGEGFDSYTVRVITSTSKELFSKEGINGNKIHLGKGLKPGLYFVQIITPKQHKVVKMIKQ